MSWQDYRRRRAILNHVLDVAGRGGPGEISIAAIPGVIDEFGCPENLLLALHHRWSTHLAARLDLAVDTAADLNTMWWELAREQPQLRAVLDFGARRYPELRHTLESDRDMMDAHDLSSLTTAKSGIGGKRDRVPMDPLPTFG